MAKRPADEAVGGPAKAAKGDNPLEVRKELFEIGGLAGEGGPGVWTLVGPGVGPLASASAIDLTYFALRGLGQVAQTCLEVSGHPYRYQVVTAPYFRSSLKAKLVFGRLPSLRTVGGQEIVQSKTVIRYVAKACGLAGETDDEVARSDMLYEMLNSEGKVDKAAVGKLAAESKTLAAAASVKTASRMEMVGFGDEQKAAASLKFWEETLSQSKSGWVLGGLGDGGSDKLSFVDLALFWDLQPCHADLEKLGCGQLLAHAKKVMALDGFARMVESGRLMPAIGEGYVYKEDDLVKKP